MNLTKEMFMRMGIATLLIPLVITFVLYQFNYTFFLIPILIGKLNFGFQILLGLAGGLFMIAVAYLMGRWKFLDAVQESYTLQLGRYKLTFQEIIFLSFCAGVGEELLFRGMIQPWLGIFFTAFLFIGLHGYLNVKSSAHLVFGILLWGMGIVLGLLSANCGLLSAILAHMIYDIYAFMNIQKEYDNLKSKQFIRNIEDEQKEI